MFKGFAKVSLTSDSLPGMEKGINALDGMDVLVGVPEEKTDRGDGSGITNAELVFIHTNGARQGGMIGEMDQAMASGANYEQAMAMFLQEHGSPLYHIPPRPIIEPAISEPTNRAVIVQDLERAGEAAVEEDIEKLKAALETAGMDAQNIVRDWFTNPKNGWAPNAPSTIAQKGSDRPLIDKGEMRKAITYVVRDKEVGP
jgi:hypothetical protein